MFSNYFNILGFKNTRKIQEEVKNVIERNPHKNILVIAGCGSGKTEVGNYALLKWNGKRSIFVEPMRTLATSIQKRLDGYNKILNINSGWTIQHSSIQEDKYLENKYCVTTIDQVLAGWLGIGRQSFIKGKNVLLSNFVFDEVQMFQPDKTLLTTINFLDSIYKRENKFVIMTATMPNYLIKFLCKRYNMQLIKADEEAVCGRKVYVNFREKLDFNKINAMEEKQIIICNTQKQQEYVFSNIENKNRCIILNNKLLNTNREKIENQLYKYFGKKFEENNKILISTSIVEAGADISAKYLYSYGCPIDRFIQRCGRCARWSGVGIVDIVKNDDMLFSESIVNRTLEFFMDNPNLDFTWEIQKDTVSKILNPFYSELVNEDSIRNNKMDLVYGGSSKLIRDIQNVNIIVDNDMSSDSENITSFNRESISISMGLLKKLSKTNDLYILNKGKIQEKHYSETLVGETIVIKGDSCIYDKLGFRYQYGGKCETFIYYNKVLDKYDRNFVDYKKETWINHAVSVKTLFKEKLLQDKYSNYIIENLELISSVGSLHDIGKLDELWQSDKWAEAGPIPLAHFPFRNSHSSLFKGRNHKFIGGVLMKNFINNTLFNVIIQHHGRIISPDHDIVVDKYKLHKNYKMCLYELGFNKKVEDEGENIKIKYKEIISPKNKEWDDFLYIVGTLMEADIEAINLFHK